MEFKVRVRGINENIRSVSKISPDIKQAAIKGTLNAAKYLLEKIKSKFGTYQSTGGAMGGRGPWVKLKYETIMRKLKRGGSKGPLVDTGKMRDSFSIVEGTKGAISASVGSNSPYLIHHVYGAPRANVPRRDPVRVTAQEESNNCTDIIRKEIDRIIEKDW